MKKVFYIFIILCLFIFSLLTHDSWAQTASLIITEMKIEPQIVNPGSKAVISCRVNHTEGSMFIKRVWATATWSKSITSYPRLYDDKTNGDIESADGIYSLEIKARETAGIAEIVFHAIDINNNEIDSESINWIVQ